MRIETRGNNPVICGDLKRHAEARVWLAVQWHRRRIPWVGVQFTEYSGEGEPRRTLCQIDLWLRGAGLVTIRHTDVNPYVAVDLAAARLKQALRRRFRQRREVARQPMAAKVASGAATAPVPPLREERLGRIARPLLSSPPRLAAVVALNDDGQSPLSLRPWLKMRYGIEQIQQVGLSQREWDALANGSDDIERFRDRLALALLSWPELILVVGQAKGAADGAIVESRRQELKRIVRRLRLWNLPVGVAGVWTREDWGSDCVLESEDLDASVWQPSVAAGAETAATPLPPEQTGSWGAQEALPCVI